MRLKKIILFSIFTVTVTTLFLYLKVPDSLVTSCITLLAQKNMPGIALQMKSARLHFPPELEIEEGRVSLTSRDMIPVESETLTITPSLWRLIRQRLSFAFVSQAYGGTVTGNADLPGKSPAEEPFLLDVAATELNLGRCGCLHSFLHREIDGVLDASFTYRGRQAGFFQGEGEVRCTLAGGSIELMKNILGLEKLTYDRIETRITIKDRDVTLSKLSIDGADVDGAFTGKIVLYDDIRKSQLNLKGMLTVPPLNKTMRIQIGGTIENPIPQFR